jgi:hypothetical protein
MAVLADRDQHHPDGLTAGGGRRPWPERAGTHTVRRLGMPYGGGAADEDRHLATEDREQVAGDGVGVK